MRKIEDLMRRRCGKSVFDRVAHDLIGPEPNVETKSPTTETVLPVEEQVRKRWNSKKDGGLPTFIPSRNHG